MAASQWNVISRVRRFRLQRANQTREKERERGKTSALGGEEKGKNEDGVNMNIANNEY